MSRLSDPGGGSPLESMVVCGDSEAALRHLPDGSVDFVFTSPPYYNARPEYAAYEDYDVYLAKIEAVVAECARLLAEGRYLAVNSSPVLVARESRNHASRRVPVPFDLHPLISAAGFEFVDDIVWVKPEGAGWATGRGRRFSADRNPLAYKAASVTEYVLVYRKATDRLIDWNIRCHPDQQLVAESRIGDGYEVTNVWEVGPASSPHHPAVFPVELAERAVRYWSFAGDVVLDPFAGIGTVAHACIRNDRRYVMCELDPGYADRMRRNVAQWVANGRQMPLGL